MAQRPDRPTSSGRRRTPAPPVKKPFPWGTVAISSVLGVLLAGILFYAATNQGSGFVDPLKAADKSIDGVSVSDKEARDHTDQPVQYDKAPPTGGKHNNTPQSCQVYTEGVPSERAVHSLEHGAVWITYNPDEISDADLATLSQYVADQTYIMMSPYAGQSSLISLQSWNHQVFVDAVDDPRINEFITLLRQNPATTPEAGATCTSPTFLADPLVEGEASRAVDPAGAPATGVPATP